MNTVVVLDYCQDDMLHIHYRELDFILDELEALARGEREVDRVAHDGVDYYRLRTEVGFALVRYVDGRIYVSRIVAKNPLPVLKPLLHEVAPPDSE